MRTFSGYGVGKLHPGGGETMNWFKQARQDFIAHHAARFGTINRVNLCNTFGISAAKASEDLSEFNFRNPKALDYDLTLKRYVWSGSMVNLRKPVWQDLPRYP